MNSPQRLHFSQKALLQALPANIREQSADAIGLLPLLTAAAENAREEIFRPLQAETSISEGKLSLLMALHALGGETTCGALAGQLGVAAPTVSIMVRRMLKETESLVEKKTSSLDGRAVIVRLTAKGSRVLEAALPLHSRRILAFFEKLSRSERLLLAGLLEKLSE